MEEANPEGLSKFLKISGWSMKHEMGDVAKDETGKVGRAEAKSWKAFIAQVEEFGLHFGEGTMILYAF